MERGEAGEEKPFAHPDLQIERMVVAEHVFPASAVLAHDGFVDDIFTVGDGFPGSRNVAKTHDFLLIYSGFSSVQCYHFRRLSEIVKGKINIDIVNEF